MTALLDLYTADRAVEEEWIDAVRSESCTITNERDQARKERDEAVALLRQVAPLLDPGDYPNEAPPVPVYRGRMLAHADVADFLSRLDAKGTR